MTSQPEKSAAERARELLAEATPGPWCAHDDAMVTCEGGWIAKCAQSSGADEEARADARLIAAAPELLAQLLQDLSTATERAQDQESQRLKTLKWAGMLKDRADGAEKLASDRLADVHALEDRLAAATERAEKAERELATSRAAHDKLSEWVRYFCESFEANADRWSIAAWKQKVRGIYEILPPKETT